jgi:prepilin-type N-terminal cleavage/methylation domain-containing protein
MRALTRRREAGFTLIEMLIVLTLIGIVGVVFANAAGQSIAVTTSTAKSLTDSAARFILSTRLSDDIRSAAAVGTTGGPGCAAPTGSTLVLWTDRADHTGAAYFVRTGTPAVANELLRESCTAGVPGPAATLAQWTGASTVTVTCEGQPVCGAVTTLAAAITPADTTVALTAAAGFPAAGPSYELTIDGEPMTITAGFGSTTLTAARSAPVTHAAGASVDYGPRTVAVNIALTGTDGANNFTLAVTRRAS